MLILTRNIYHILQNAKRLRTFSRPQQKEIQPIDPVIFDPAAIKKIITLKSAFTNLQSNTNKDQIKTITLHQLLHLQIQTTEGNFVFKADVPSSTLFYTSPFTGVYKYYYNIQQERFSSNKDQHLFDENVSREVLGKLGGILEI